MIYEWSRCIDAVFGSHIGRIPTHSKLFGVYFTMQQQLQLQQQQLVSVFAPFSPYLIDLFIWGYLTKSANQCYTVEPRPPREDNSYWTVQLTGSADKCSWDKLDWAFPVSWVVSVVRGISRKAKETKETLTLNLCGLLCGRKTSKFANPKITETF